MWRTVGLILWFLVGCILMLIAILAILCMPRRYVEPWRLMPPPRR